MANNCKCGSNQPNAATGDSLISAFNQPNSSSVQAGEINGNPLGGLCERICVEVTKVLDGCKTQNSNANFTLKVTEIPATAVPPFSFISCCSCGEATLTNTSVTPIGENCCRVMGDVTIPLTVTFRDSNGVCQHAKSSLKLSRDVNLRGMQNGCMPYQIRTAANLISRTGNFVSADTISFAACYVIINKVITVADVLLPTYGNCVYPLCNSPEDAACNRLLETTSTLPCRGMN